MHIITLTRLCRANRDVVNELHQLGFWNDSLARTQVYLIPFSWSAYGWQWYGGDGSIRIPAVSLLRVAEKLTGETRTSLRDVLRHEYGHALADTHRGLFRSRQFSEAFGVAHESEYALEYDPDHHFSEYASTDGSEDFAEVFMLYVKHGGRLPAWLHLPGIKQRWRFINRLRRAMRAGRRKWA